MHAFVGIVIDTLVLVFDADGQRFFGVEDQQVGITAGSNRTLAREKAEEFGGHGRNQVNEVLQIEFPLAHTLVEQHDAMLYPRQTIGYRREIVQTQFFLTMKVEWRGSCCANREFATLQAEPERLIIGKTAHGRRANILRALKTGGCITAIIEKEILRACLTPDRQAFFPRGSHGTQGVRATDMYHVKRRFRQCCQRYGALGSLTLQNAGSGQRMIYRRGMTCRNSLPDYQINHDTVLRVYHH